jgi:hypothetical protein
MQRKAEIVYVSREKRKGVPHHAKAGNINSAILKEGPGKASAELLHTCRTPRPTCSACEACPEGEDVGWAAPRRPQGVR